MRGAGRGRPSHGAAGRRPPHCRANRRCVGTAADVPFWQPQPPCFPRLVQAAPIMWQPSIRPSVCPSAHPPARLDFAPHPPARPRPGWYSSGGRRPERAGMSPVLAVGGFSSTPAQDQSGFSVSSGRGPVSCHKKPYSGAPRPQGRDLRLVRVLSASDMNLPPDPHAVLDRQVRF